MLLADLCWDEVSLTDWSPKSQRRDCIYTGRVCVCVGKKERACMLIIRRRLCMYVRCSCGAALRLLTAVPVRMCRRKNSPVSAKRVGWLAGWQTAALHPGKGKNEKSKKKRKEKKNSARTQWMEGMTVSRD